ncbi:hypothetical protein R3W88_030877 [Solanum pinnatisectum]|uniref:Uncharacterized protein n=1 Tax=Solanum pinnatisectum TaxID=50273 RepID=A0AAV9LNE4_9SOLN|nr:hypothetical protein R3W88_030877 [Solanum pinnatisectum]
MNIPINLRTRLISLPQVEKSFGNLGVDAPLKFIPGENKMELHEFVTLIHDTVKDTIITCDKTSPEDIVSAVSNIYNEKCGNGICVQVDLKEDNMHLFECDNDIKDFFQF